MSISPTTVDSMPSYAMVTLDDLHDFDDSASDITNPLIPPVTDEMRLEMELIHQTNPHPVFQAPHRQQPGHRRPNPIDHPEARVATILHGLEPQMQDLGLLRLVNGRIMSRRLMKLPGTHKQKAQTQAYQYITRERARKLGRKRC
ncbi:hypothetical protein BJV78DRAFT_1280065 [Lactifluus subvellereus]|nr:hypothetical protein BJV78DRAFT_1280065 [Lactifluus subvellereus]